MSGASKVVGSGDAALKEHKRKILHVSRILEEKYGRNIYPEERSLVETLLFRLYAAENPVTNSRKALRDLREEFVDWNEVRVSTPREIEATLAESRLEPSLKLAERTRDVLQRLYAELCHVNLDALNEDAEKRKAVIQKLDGILTPDEVEFLSLVAGVSEEAPQDPATIRVLVRLGVLGANDLPPRRRKVLKALAPTAADALRLHHLMLEHGKKVCLAEEPKCPKCVVQLDCAFYKAELVRRKAAREAAKAGPRGRARAGAKRAAGAGPGGRDRGRGTAAAAVSAAAKGRKGGAGNRADAAGGANTAGGGRGGAAVAGASPAGGVAAGAGGGKAVREREAARAAAQRRRSRRRGSPGHDGGGGGHGRRDEDE